MQRVAGGRALLLGAFLAVCLAWPAPGAWAAVTHDEPPIGTPPGGSAGAGGAGAGGGAGPIPGGGGGGGGVLVVGDSLELLTGPYLRRHLRGVPLTINAVGGYNSFQILDLFQQSFRPSHSVVVFDGGTNDNPSYPQILAGNLARVAEAVGDRCLVVPSIHGLVVGGVGNAGKNRAVHSFAASRPGTQVPDWAGAVAADPGLLQSDDLHPTPEGADYRARLIAAGVAACRASASPDFAEPTATRRVIRPAPVDPTRVFVSFAVAAATHPLAFATRYYEAMLAPLLARTLPAAWYRGR